MAKVNFSVCCLPASLPSLLMSKWGTQTLWLGSSACCWRYYWGWIAELVRLDADNSQPLNPIDCREPHLGFHWARWAGEQLLHTVIMLSPGQGKCLCYLEKSPYFVMFDVLLWHGRELFEGTHPEHCRSSCWPGVDGRPSELPEGCTVLWLSADIQ